MVLSLRYKQLLQYLKSTLFAKHCCSQRGRDKGAIATPKNFHWSLCIEKSQYNNCTVKKNKAFLLSQ